MKLTLQLWTSMFTKRGTLFQPETKHDGHPLDHLDQAVVEPGGVPLKQQHDGVGVVDGAGQGRHHLLDQNLVLVVRISKAGGVHNLDKIRKSDTKKSNSP